MKKYLIVLCLLSAVLVPQPAALAQPANDNFANAATLTGVSVTTSGNSGQFFFGIPNATEEPNEPNHAGFNGGRSVWFNWTAPTAGTVVIDTIGSQFNTLLGVYTGTAVNALTQIAANNDIGGGTNTSLVQFAAVAGTTYRIAVDGRSNNNPGNPSSGPYVLRVNLTPFVTITSPAPGTSVLVGTPVVITATAAVPTPPVTRMDFYRNGNLIGSDDTAPYSFTNSSPPLGANSYVAVAVNGASDSWASLAVGVLVVNPGVTLTAPADGTTFLNANPIVVSAIAFSSSGPVTNVSFLVDGQVFAQDVASPFGVVWNSVTPGAHVLSAVALDNLGNSFFSAPVAIAVARALVSSNSTWKYLDNGTDPGPNWHTPGFDDTAWAAGPAPLGYGDSAGRPPLTVNSFGPDMNNKYPATYYRQAFVATDLASYTNLLLRLERDDGVIVYLNDVEVARINMPEAGVTFTTFASGNAPDDGTTQFSINLPLSRLVEGTNVVAAEVHQDNATSSDIWFVLEALALPIIQRNRAPSVTLDSPTNFASFLAPASVSLAATASDADGSVARVEFFDSGTRLGEDTVDPYQFTWNSPAVGWHSLYAVATDLEGASTTSASAFVSVYDAVGTPLVQLFSPTPGAVFDGPTNLSLVAGTTTPGGATNVQFFTNDVLLGQTPFLNPTSPVLATLTWTNAAFGTNTLRAVSFDASGRTGTSAPVIIVVNTPPPNTNAPTIAAVIPARGATIGALTNIQVTFSERVAGVNAADLRVDGVAALSVSGSGSNYTFTVAQPAAGTLAITWAAGHDIEDLGYPPLPFDGTEAGETWTYNLTDLTPPTVASQVPTAGTTVTNLSQVTVNFSEPVQGVDASDFIVQGTPAIGVSGGGASYTFSFSQPPAGTVTIAWAAGHGIVDLAPSPNAFNGTGPGATWNYNLDARTTLVQSNATWLFLKGQTEASSPAEAWRDLAFNDSNWSNAPAPFYYGPDPYASAANPGTLLSDMLAGYSSIYLRNKFVVPNAASVTNLLFNSFVDDGYIVWINGVEVLRVNAPAGASPAYNAEAPTAASEPNGNNGGVPYAVTTLPNPAGYLVDGTNVLAVHAFNNTPATSSDFGFNGQLYTFLADPGVVAPRLASVTPPAGDVFALTSITVRFTEPVAGVNASDLLVHGLPASSVASTTNTTYTFNFPQPAFGPVNITWSGGHGIEDFDAPPKPFDGAAPGSTFTYSLLNPSAPTVASQAPQAGATVSFLTNLTVSFTESVTGVDAGDLRVNGAPATGVNGGPVNYTFSFPQPGYGPVSLGWASDHGITDLEVPANPFDGSRSVNLWSYTLVDQTPPFVSAQNPPAGAQVTNLNAVTVTYSEAVAGVNASDLLINGAPATGVTGGPATYIFTFATPNAVILNISWAAAHGIRDLATVPNGFDRTGPGATWTYTTPDNQPPAVTAIEPPPFVTVRSLTQVRVTFNEAVTGVTTNSLLVNNRPVRSVAGSGAGPYTFTFLSPGSGSVDLRWAVTHGIFDLATPPNAFPGGEWNYLLDPNATFAGKIILNEIMYDAATGRPEDEWVELHNVTTNLINLAGWRFTRGANFTFPNVSIPAGGHLVVAASTAAFQTNYPGVSNVVGGWTGSLANSDETLELETALGEVVQAVHYASEGDWARRERGNGASAATITRNGNTATVAIFQHSFTGNDQVIISGADQPEYNGRFVVSNNGLTPSTFNFNVAGTPATPATGNIICRWVLDDGFSGWSWFSAASGFGHSMELVNPGFDNGTGQNWLASTNAGGTPGRANSVRTNNIAPLILDLAHSPPVPHSDQPVTITARVRDELAGGVGSVQLFYRTHTAPGAGPFSSTNMLDDGGHNDGLNGDGIYGAILPAAAHRTVVEFYLQASDAGGRVRTWPAAAWETNDTLGQFANALYQVDNESISNNMPILRTVMSGTERAIFPPSNRQSDAAYNLTLISTENEGTQIRYCCDARIRGAGSRNRNVVNNRLAVPNDRRWNNRASLNLNSLFVHAQMIGHAAAAKAGLPNEEAYVVQYRLNGSNSAPISAPQNGSGNGAGWGVFLLAKPTNGDLMQDIFPEDGDGNVYRASTGNHNADLSYQGTNPNNYLGRGYSKTSNRGANDWTDLMNLTFAMGQVAGDADYTRAILTNVNVVMWMRYFAVGTLVNFGETSLFNGRGDDYGLYRGLHDPRFLLLPHDFDTVFGQGDTGPTYYPINTNSSIYIMLNPPNTGGSGQPSNVPLLRRLLTHPDFAPVFFSELKRLCDTTFHPSQLRPLMDQHIGANIWGVGPDSGTVEAMKSYAENRRVNVLAQIPLALTVNHTLAPQSGYLFSATPATTLFGTSHAIETRRVLVNGTAATWSPWDARWTNAVTLQPGLNTVLVQSLNSNDVEISRATIEVWYDDGSVQTVSGAVAVDTVWSAANGPYQVSANLTVNAGVTLTIQSGTTVYLDSGVNVAVANGGRLLAEGTDAARIRFGRAPGTAANWGGITINGGAGSPESRIAYAHFEFNGATAIHAVNGTLFLDHLTFGNTGVQYLSLDASSFVVQDCVFPATTAGFESVHGNQGIKAGGRGIFLRNFWGRVQAYNDACDFTGGNRPGPVVQFLHNVFMGSDDDLLDLDGTDAWVEGNIFLHTHRNGTPDSASAVSGGNDSGQTSEITVVGNLFFDVDQAANAKQGNFYTMVNNTIVRQNRTGSEDTNTAVVILADDGTTQGAGLYLEGNIIAEAENLTRNVTTALVTFTNNLIHQLQGPAWSGPGGNNPTGDPLFQRVPTVLETSNFTSWAAAQVLWDWLSLQPGSPARGTGPSGRDKGAVAYSPAPLNGGRAGVRGVAVDGVPPASTSRNSATLRVGVNVTGNGVPGAGFPNGSGFTHYRWRLDGGPWSAETPVTSPISLTSLSQGAHYVEVSGRNDAGFYQDDPVFGRDAHVTVSRTWTVNTSLPALRLNEILASNGGAVNHFGTTPDVIELFNDTGADFDLGGVGLSDDRSNPAKFLFPLGTTLSRDAFLVVYANNNDGTPGLHLGFNLPQSGGTLYLHDSGENGGQLLDSITFGLQLTDLSIGRLADGAWALGVPTFGAANRPANVGDPRGLRLNEWLAFGVTPFDTDFIEIFNTGPLPVPLGGLYLSDHIVGWRDRHEITPLSFIAGGSYLRFLADGNDNAGAEHLNFSLPSEQGTIGLFLPDLTPIDCVTYGPQRENVSQGRSPNGGTALAYFDIPSPGAPNPIVTGSPPFGGGLVINEVLAANTAFSETVGTNVVTPDWVEIYNGTTGLVDVANMSLTDDPLLPRRFVFPVGSYILEPGDLLRVRCDSSLPASTAGSLTPDAGFSLKSSGGAVYFYDTLASGAGRISSITYGIQVENFSVGRVPDGSTNWVLTSPTRGTPNVAIPTLGSAASLHLNEWMADAGSGNADWFELYNPEGLPVALGGLYLSDDLATRTQHRIAALSYIGTGTNAWLRFAADGQTASGADHVSFSLRAAGEDIALSTEAGVLISGFSFTNQLPNVSEGLFPDGSASVISFPGTASPGAPNWRRLATVLIHEVLSHTDMPLEDAIELHNTTAQPLDISGWWLSDDPGTLRKYQIPFATVIPPQGFTVIYETHFTNRLEAAVPFALSSKGDEIVLSAATNNALTGYRATEDFGAAENGVSFGRYVTSDARAEFVAMSARTFGRDDPGSVAEFRLGTGTNNAYPKVGPVIVSEVMYHPPGDDADDEFIELRNITTAEVLLYDPAAPTNTWRLRDAVDFNLPGGLALPGGSELLVVGFDPVNNLAALGAFRSKYHVDPNTPIVGPWSGRLGNGDDDIELRKPDSPNAGDVPYVLVERVHYYDAAPWPIDADGAGLSLHRLSESGFGNDSTNWFAAEPTPGPQAGSADTDADGMPDAWENLYAFDRLNPADADLDSDGDGLTNVQEFQAGTNPRDSASVLRFRSVTRNAEGTHVLLTFAAAASQGYSILWREHVASGNWTKLADVAPGPERLETIQDPLPALATRFYLLVTPAAPGLANPQPAVLMSPRAQVADIGGEVEFAVLAVGDGPLGYQWMLDGTPLEKADDPTLTLTNVNWTTLGAYTVRVQDPHGTTTSGPVYLSVRPRIVLPPESQHVTVGATVSLGVEAEGYGALSYRWWRDRRALAGETNATLVLTNVQRADAGRYFATVTQHLPWGSYSTTSPTARLSIGGAPGPQDLQE